MASGELYQFSVVVAAGVCGRVATTTPTTTTCKKKKKLPRQNTNYFFLLTRNICMEDEKRVSS
jgi:hypothetical protein